MDSQVGVLPPNFSKGPHGLGDPNDKSLRRVETEVLIPMRMRDIAKNEKCKEYVNDFTKCCKENGMTMVLTCRNENNRLKECMEKWFKDESFRQECTDIYLKERSQYRELGKEKHMKRKDSVMF